ncbi:MAG TPA: PadR family transcriptional regulator [Planctomycetota bacterium]|nr:PadR family transcriptional regulator [Planctomycetota bacterium]
MRSWVTQLRKGLLEFCVLNVLSTGESYGYQLVRRLEMLEELAITESTVYPILNRLRKDGYVKVRLAGSASGPPRRYFSLTALGSRRVREMKAYWDDLCVSVGRLRRKEEEGDS